jgi:hypothetical protein
MVLPTGRQDDVIDLDDATARPSTGRLPPSAQPHPAAAVLDDEWPDLGDAEAARVTDNDDGSKTLKLNWPVTVRYRQSGGGERTEEIAELVIRRPKGRDMRALGGMAAAQAGTQMLCRLAGISQAAFDALDGADIAAAMKIVADFLGSGRGTGRS